MPTTGEIYVSELDIEDLHAEVGDALRDAVACFRAEMYTPCLAMLGKAAEGAWTEMGLALAAMAVGSAPDRAAALTKDLLDEQYTLVRRLQRVMRFYEGKTLCGAIWKTASVDRLRQVETWADLLRDARNAVHYKAANAVPTTHENVSVLLLGARPYLRLIYEVRRAA